MDKLMKLISVLTLALEKLISIYLQRANGLEFIKGLKIFYSMELNINLIKSGFKAKVILIFAMDIIMKVVLK
jgi:hypothetical protein